MKRTVTAQDQFRRVKNTRPENQVPNQWNKQERTALAKRWLPWVSSFKIELTVPGRTSSKSRSGLRWNYPLSDECGCFCWRIHLRNNPRAPEFPWKVRFNQWSPFCRFSFICYKFILCNRHSAPSQTIWPHEAALTANPITLQNSCYTINFAARRWVYTLISCPFQHWEEDCGYRGDCAIIFDARVEACYWVCRKDWKVDERNWTWSHHRAGAGRNKA